MLNTMHHADLLQFAHDEHRHRIRTAQRLRISRLLRRSRAPGASLDREEVALAA